LERFRLPICSISVVVSATGPFLVKFELSKDSPHRYTVLI
jgi:hypothetical protein